MLLVASEYFLRPVFAVPNDTHAHARKNRL